MKGTSNLKSGNFTVREVQTLIVTEELKVIVSSTVHFTNRRMVRVYYQ